MHTRRASQCCRTQIVAAVLSLLTAVAAAQAGLRTLTGVVEDPHHEPLKGAVVQVQDESTGSVVSFLSERDGTYHFRRLSPGDDYKVWATYRGHRSKTHEMSHFDSKLDKTIAIVIDLD